MLKCSIYIKKQVTTVLEVKKITITITKESPMKSSAHVRKFFILCLFVVMLMPSVAFCNGYGGFILGSKSRAMGNAFVGLADNPSAVSINPAGIIHLDKTQILAGFTLAEIHGKFVSSGDAGINKNGYEASLEKQDALIPNLYITHKFNDWFALGFGEYTVYGTSFIWNDDFEGRYVPCGKEGTMQTMTFSPVAAFKIVDGLSLGLGVRLEYLKTVFDNVNYIFPGFPQPEVKLIAKDFAVAWDVAALYKITDNFSAGIHYRSEINHDTDKNDVKFSPQIRMLQIRNTDASFEFTFPQNVTFGIAWNQGPVTLTLDGTWWDWSHSNQRLLIKFKDDVAFKSTQISPWDWDDTWSVGIGGEYRINALNRVIALRAGYMWDQSPVPGSTVGPPDGFHNDNHEFTIGAGIPIGPFTTDLYFGYVYTEDREWNNAIGDNRHPGRVFSQRRITGEFEDFNTYTMGIDLTYKF